MVVVEYTILAIIGALYFQVIETGIKEMKSERHNSKQK